MEPSTKSHGAAQRNTPRAWISVFAGVVALGWLISTAAEDVPDGTLSAAIRASGHPCAKVIEKTHSGGGSAKWQVRCNSGRFQVTQKDDSTFEVESLD